jgi:predicted amidohydrolase YtcJ
MRCFLNARVRTLNGVMPHAEAVVARGGRIAYVGTSEGARKFAGPEAEVIDLGGKLVLPGFIDNHVHFVLGGTAVDSLNLRDCTSAAALAEAVAKFASTHKGNWLTGGDWNEAQWDVPSMPTRALIDPILPDVPAFLNRSDWHMGLANAVALQRAGITKDTPDPPGGTIEHDPATGEPTGIVKDAAMEMVTRVIPRPTPGELEHAILQALDVARRNGVTSVQDIGEEEHIPIYHKLEGEQKLTCRIYARLPIAGMSKLIRERVRRAHGTEFVKVGSLKAFADGSLGSSTAWFFDPYEHAPTSGLGMEVVTSGRLREWALEADKHGLQLSIHAIGDRANDAMLTLFEEIVRENPGWDRRFRIEHAQHVRPQDFARFASLGVIVSAQPCHCIDDGVWAEQRIGHERAKSTYAFRSFLDAGVRLCFGSDWTVAPLDPILGIYAAVTRATVDGKNPDGWIPEQKLTAEEAVKCYTVHNAYASFEEHLKGSIAPGKLADMVVLSDDIFAMPAAEIRNARVVMTVVDGRVVFSEDESAR